MEEAKPLKTVKKEMKRMLNQKIMPKTNTELLSWMMLNSPKFLQKLTQENRLEKFLLENQEYALRMAEKHVEIMKSHYQKEISLGKLELSRLPLILEGEREMMMTEALRMSRPIPEND